MDNQAIALQEQQRDRAHRLRKEGVEYKLRVIKGSGGQLELVEQPPKDQHWFHQLAQMMQFSGWMP